MGPGWDVNPGASTSGGEAFARSPDQLAGSGRLLGHRCWRSAPISEASVGPGICCCRHRRRAASITANFSAERPATSKLSLRGARFPCRSGIIEVRTRRLHLGAERAAASLMRGPLRPGHGGGVSMWWSFRLPRCGGGDRARPLRPVQLAIYALIPVTLTCGIAGLHLSVGMAVDCQRAGSLSG